VEGPEAFGATGRVTVAGVKGLDIALVLGLVWKKVTAIVDASGVCPRLGCDRKDVGIPEMPNPGVNKVTVWRLELVVRGTMEVTGGVRLIRVVEGTILVSD